MNLLSVESVIRRWMAKRRPLGPRTKLGHKNIFIFPTLAGWGYLLLCCVLFLIATNYQNNLIHGVLYLLLAVGVLTMHYTFLNLSGVEVRLLRAHNCFAGELAEFELRLQREGRPAESILLCWQGQAAEQVDMDQDGVATVRLYAQSRHRGVLRPGLLKVETRYPFGLLRAWSWLDPQAEVLVYPAPLAGRVPVSRGSGDKGTVTGSTGGDDFMGYGSYQPGSSPSHIAWKQYARRGELLLKQYPEHQDQKLWLRWQDWPEMGTEQRLSVICYWALQYYRSSIDYGLELPGQSIAPASGSAHLQRVLQTLACFPGGNG